jgi:hypothetical protein
MLSGQKGAISDDTAGTADPVEEKSLTLAELVEAYLEHHDVEAVTIEKLRWLLGKAVVVFGDRPVGELHSQEIAAWRIALSPGYRFDATQALRRYSRAPSSGG